MIRRICQYRRSVQRIIFEYFHKLITIAPCYVVIDRLTSSSIVIDIGTGVDADFSQALIARFGLSSYGFDPTKKHLPFLENIVKDSDGKFHFFPYAVSNYSGTKTFFESQQNVSGSFYSDHVNVKKDTIQTYDVRTATMDEIIDLLDGKQIDLVKMDTEGEEYAIISSLSDRVFSSVNQFVIEFHYHCVDHFSFSQTQVCIDLFHQHGFKSYTKDQINYLFFQP